MPEQRPWHILTPEYPPQLGGVADYTQQVASALALTGSPVHIWAPGEPSHDISGIALHALSHGFPVSSLRTMSRFFNSHPGPHRLLVQWVPHGFGCQSMNLPLCIWLLNRALAGDRVDVMVHEPFLRFHEGSWRQDIAAGVHRVMVTLLLRAATRVWVSTLDWVSEIKPWAFGRELGFDWLPVPNNIPVSASAGEIAAIRAQYGAPGKPLVGHFGTFGSGVRQMLQPLLAGLLAEGNAPIVLLGPGSLEFGSTLLGQLAASSLYATGALSPHELSNHLSACDLLLQPYPDGVNGRRGSVMAALAHGRAVLTTEGRATESVWKESGAVALVPGEQPAALASELRALLSNPARREQLGRDGRLLYHRRFGLERTVEALLQPAA